MLKLRKIRVKKNNKRILKKIITFFIFFSIQKVSLASEVTSPQIIKACILSCNLTVDDIEFLSKDLTSINKVKKEYKYHLELCYFPRIPRELSQTKIEELRKIGLTIKVLDNNEIEMVIPKKSYHLVFAMRTLCICPPKCKCESCTSIFLNKNKTCGGIQIKDIRSWIDVLQSLLAPGGIALISGQSITNLKHACEDKTKFFELLSDQYHHLCEILYTYRPTRSFFKVKIDCPTGHDFLTLFLGFHLERFIDHQFFFKLITMYERINESTKSFVDTISTNEKSWVLSPDSLDDILY